MRCEFSINHYQYLLEESKRLGYIIYSFADWMESKGNLDGDRTIIMRHDVDVSVKSALTFAEVESDYGVTSTFFYRLHARYYDLNDSDTLASAIQLAKTSDVGLHYERMYYDSVDGSYRDLLMKDKNEMTRIFGHRKYGCAAHLPGKMGSLGEDLVRSSGFAFEAYSSQFVIERKYISDSRARWREGCLCKWLGQEDHLTVLVHPVWWTGWPESTVRVIERLGKGD